YLEPSSSAGCRFDLQPEFQWVRATELAPSEARQLCHLAIRQAKREDCPLSWISPEFISKYFCRSSYWQDLPSTFEWRLGYMNGEIAAAFCVDRANVYLNGWPVRGVLIGSLMFDEGHDERLMAQLEQAVTEASVDCDVVSFPACHPVPIFGAGVESWKANGGQATDKPLFEASLPKRLLNALSFEGCSVGAHKGYAYVELSEMSPTEPTPLSGTLKIRDFDRTDFRNETTDFIHPIFCETIAKLDMCSEVPASTLTGLVQDLRELAVPGLWLMAECLGEPAGFALCYPNISAEFQRVAGNADVADYHRIQEKMESAREAFLAWIAVRPEFSGEGVSAALVEQLRSRLLARHYTHIWLSWEFVDGDISMEQHCERFGDVVRVVEMPCYVTRNSTASSQPSTRHAKMSS
ncbi:MAG: GNAT family N-acetyltransferase, partial [Planctomycetales bacterium]|nr:GNAT family N-acetyltransferase [Planctomycetales bacterium]